MKYEDDQAYDRMIRTFLAEHPEWREHVRWERIPRAREPQALIRPKAMEAFTRWVYERGMIRKPHQIPALFDLMHAMERDSTPHNLGLCNPETCVYCRHSPPDRGCDGLCTALKIGEDDAPSTGLRDHPACD